MKSITDNVVIFVDNIFQIRVTENLNLFTQIFIYFNSVLSQKLNIHFRIGVVKP